MADYFFPTVIQQSIPLADITPLERLVLGAIFDAEPDGDAVYFSTDVGPNTQVRLCVHDLRAAIEASANTDSEASAFIVARLGDAEPDCEEVEIDFSGVSWECILQDIVRRSPTIEYLTAVTSFTCSKMRPDGFGGMVALITAHAVTGKSTEDILCDLLDAAKDDAVAAATGTRTHVLLTLSEDDVRASVEGILEDDDTLTALAADAISDADINAGCADIVGRIDLNEEYGAAIFNAALAAIHHAKTRLSASDRAAPPLDGRLPAR